VGDGVAAAGHSLGTQAAARQGSGSCGTDHEPANLLHPGTHRGQSDKPAGTHRHADVADAAVEQEGGEVRGCLAGCLCVHRHARRLPLGLRNLVAHVEGRGTQRVLRGGRTCVAGARAAAVSREGGGRVCWRRRRQCPACRKLYKLNYCPQDRLIGQIPRTAPQH
jgi:hypothetical protein